MLNRNRTHFRHDGARNLSEVDLGVRQCVQLLWTCIADNNLDPVQFEKHWEQLTHRALRDFLEDQRLLECTVPQAGGD